MGIIEEAGKRLRTLSRTDVALPAEGALRLLTEARLHQADEDRLSRTPAEPRAGAAFGKRPLAWQAAPEGVRQSRPGRSVTLDLAQLERAGQVVPSQSRSLLAQEFRMIKRPLLKNIRDASSDVGNRLPLIVVSSALPGEGKTFCAVNLALSMAIEVDTPVLLVDADVVHPDIPRRLALETGKGLLDLLTEPGLDLPDVVLETNVPQLAILPAGTLTSRSTELLASDAMDQMLAELARRYRVVVFDAPPLLLTTEAGVLASRVGQVLLVVEAGRTPRSAIEQAFEAVGQCPTVMSLLNKGSDPLQHSGYGDYYA